MTVAESQIQHFHRNKMALRSRTPNTRYWKRCYVVKFTPLNTYYTSYKCLTCYKYRTEKNQSTAHDVVKRSNWRQKLSKLFLVGVLQQNHEGRTKTTQKFFSMLLISTPPNLCKNCITRLSSQWKYSEVNNNMG